MTIVNRRKFLGTSAGGLGLLGLSGAMPAWARGADISAGNARKGLDEVSGPNIDLTVARSAFATGNRRGGAIAVNGTIPGPLLRLQEGTTVRWRAGRELPRRQAGRNLHRRIPGSSGGHLLVALA